MDNDQEDEDATDHDTDQEDEEATDHDNDKAKDGENDDFYPYPLSATMTLPLTPSHSKTTAQASRPATHLLHS